MKKVGCEVIHFGVESGSQEIIKKIGKNINLSWAKEIMCYANKQNIHVVASFIIGHFCDTERTIQETISLMEILRNSGIEVSVAGCVPFRERLYMSIRINWEFLYTHIHGKNMILVI